MWYVCGFGLDEGGGGGGELGRVCDRLRDGVSGYEELLSVSFLARWLYKL